jgi:hypothetical protein
VQGVRLILTICLLASSAAAGYCLVEYGHLPIAAAIWIVVGLNLALAAILLIVVVAQKPRHQGGLAELFGGKSSQARALLRPLVLWGAAARRCLAACVGGRHLRGHLAVWSAFQVVGCATVTLQSPCRL